MKRKLTFFTSCFLALMLGFGGLFLMMFSPKQATVSEKERRMLSAFPDLSRQTVLSGEFQTGLDDFLSDNFIGRELAIDLTDELTDAASVLTEDERMALETLEMEQALEKEAELTASGARQTQQEQDAPPAQPEEPVTDEPEKEFGSDGQIDEVPFEGEPAVEGELSDDNDDSGQEAAGTYIKEKLTKTNAYMWFEDKEGRMEVRYTYPRDKIRTFAGTLKLIRKNLPEDGTVHFVVSPLASQGNELRNSTKYVGWGSSVETALNEELAETEGIYVYSAWELLEPYVKGKTRMFYVTDHHWTAEATYKVTAEMLKNQNLPVIPYEDYTYKAIISAATNKKGQHDTFNVLYPLYPSEGYMIGPNYSRKIEVMQYKNQGYHAFSNGGLKTWPWKQFKTGAGTGRNCLVIADSFGDALAPWLFAYYDEVNMVDFRGGAYDHMAAGGYIKDNIKRYKISDVYVVCSTANDTRKNNVIYWMRKYLGY
ncbi:MAG: hypothetical protein K5663_09705 [Clostridiales bacterium]|nr:hypothetical protein [Clostridiales bacterium]